MQTPSPRRLAFALSLAALALGASPRAAAAASDDARPRFTLQVDPLTTALGFVHAQLEWAFDPAWSVYVGPSVHLFPGLLAEDDDADFTGLGVELGVRYYFHGAAPEGAWVLLRGVMAHLQLDDPPDTTAFGGYVSALVGYTALFDGWFVLSGGLGVQYVHYEVAGSGTVGVLPAAHTALGVAF
ncbi:MAG: hypothetical protein KC635_08050 [Myxococcales bacterium]|nr:hypothetical protein [Myxococcales bacterium]